jgi:hypothetical protein
MKRDKLELKLGYLQQTKEIKKKGLKLRKHGHKEEK